MLSILGLEICLRKLDPEQHFIKNELMPSNSGVIDGL